jgi:predicted HTH transcriptional regulator
VARLQGRQELRRDITAFANADGGVLVFGVTEQPVVGKAPRGTPAAFASCHGDLDALVERMAAVIRELSAQLYPQPRAPRRVRGPSGEELIVLAIPRSLRLGAATESGSARYYTRIGEGRAVMPSAPGAARSTRRRTSAA